MDRLLGTSCEVLKKKNSENSFKKHLKYREIRKVYREGGKRKHPLPMGKEELLCPTLSEFHKSGRGPQFLEKDLSMISGGRSATASGIWSPRKSELDSPTLRMGHSQI